MNRYIKEDAEKLRKYFQTYSLESVFNEDDFLEDYKIVHKKALGYLVVFCEVEKQNNLKKIFEDHALFYLKESISDVLQSVFAWVNGAYKGADLLLRSSIENFNKAIIGNAYPAVYIEKSVYRIFEIAETMSQYQIEVAKENFEVILHRAYAELCKSTHTATNANMDHITALNLLPKYEEQKSKEYMKVFEVLIDTYLGFFLANHKEVIDKMYMANSDIFYDALSKNIIRDIINN